MLQVSIETPSLHTPLLFSLHFFIYFDVSGSRKNLIKVKACYHAVRDDGRPEMICDGLLHFYLPFIYSVEKHPSLL